MLRPFLLSLMVVGVGASGVGEMNSSSDVATWRWQVSSILAAQRSASSVSAAVAGYAQRYERYENQGQPAPTPILNR